jgi:hypothetical protein
MALFKCLFRVNHTPLSDHGWKEKIWSRRFQAIVTSSEEGAQVERLRYVLSHGCKEGLVARLAEWPGVHSGLYPPRARRWSRPRRSRTSLLISLHLARPSGRFYSKQARPSGWQAPLRLESHARQGRRAIRAAQCCSGLTKDPTTAEVNDEEDEETDPFPRDAACPRRSPDASRGGCLRLPDLRRPDLRKLLRELL